MVGGSSPEPAASPSSSSPHSLPEPLGLGGPLEPLPGLELLEQHAELRVVEQDLVVVEVDEVLLVRVGERRWDVVLDRDQRILLPEINPVPALEKLIVLDHAQDLFARDLLTIDMRNPARPTIRLSEAAVETLQQIRQIDLSEFNR